MRQMIFTLKLSNRLRSDFGRAHLNSDVCLKRQSRSVKCLLFSNILLLTVVFTLALTKNTTIHLIKKQIVIECIIHTFP
jgi:hypothetical protein